MFFLYLGKSSNINKIDYVRDNKTKSSKVADQKNFDSFCFSGNSIKTLKKIGDIEKITVQSLEKSITGEKKPIVFMDVDGVISRSIPNPFETKVHNEELFRNTLQIAKKNNMPIFALTGRQISDFDFIFNGKIPESLNLIGMYGNEFSINLPKNKKTKAFIDYWKQQKGYKIQILKNNDSKKIKVSVYPHLEKTPERKILEKEINELSNLGFTIENKHSVSFLMKWNEMFDKTKGTTLEKPFILNKKFSDNFFMKLESWNAKNKIVSSENAGYIKIKRKSDNKEMVLSAEKVVEFGIDSLNENACRIFKLSNPPDINKNKVYKHFEISHPLYNKMNKGNILEQVTKVYNKPLPIFFGDSIGVGKTDEYAMEATSKMGGIGIGVLDNGFDRQTRLSDLENKISTAKLTSESFEDTASHLKNIVEIYSKKISL